MIIVDRELKQRELDGQPIRVGMIGAGFMAQGIAMQLLRSTPGIDLVAISNRNLDRARSAYQNAGVDDVREVNGTAELENSIDDGVPCVTNDPLILCQAGQIDAVIEVTGAVEFGSRVALEAIQNRKHVILMNAELDSTVGPILKTYADANGVVITNADGDQPGVIMNLYRFVKGIGVKPVLCGNIKGLHDPYRNPTTQEGFARKWGQNPSMVTSFADGSKISFEQAIVANATGMRVARRGMYGPTVPTGTPITDVASLFPIEEMLDGPGIVDYVVGAVPSPGVFVLGTHDDPKQQHYLRLYKLGDGPLYCFYTPYHLCHFEVPNTVTRAVLFGDATIAPQGAPCVEVVTTAKRDLKAGELLDGIGRFMTYGVAENADVVRADELLPLGLAEGCRVLHDVKKDEVLSYSDVKIPPNRVADRLREEQEVHFQKCYAAKRSPDLVHA